MNKKVYATRQLPKRVMEEFARICEYDVNPENRQATHEELVNGVKNYAVMVTMLNDQIDAELLSHASPDLKLIAN